MNFFFYYKEQPTRITCWNFTYTL